MSTIVLDASALIAWLTGEPGAERVEAVLSDTAMTTVNLAEVTGFLVKRGGTEDDLRQILTPIPVAWIPFDVDLAYRAGLLLPPTRAAGLSLGDRACLALAQRLGVPAMTADRAWAAIAPAVKLAIETIR
jgi:ribonuclease VapC